MELRVLPRNFLKQGVSAEYGWGVARRGVVPPFGLSLFIYLWRTSNCHFLQSREKMAYDT